MTKTSAQYQRDYIAAQKAKGFKRLVLWVQPEDVETFQLAAQQPHAMAKLRRRIRTEIEPTIRDSVNAELTRKTRRAMLAHERAKARRLQAGSNRPPEMIRFAKRPPAKLRNRLKDVEGWWYDGVKAVWHLPDDPEAWPATQKLLDELDAYDIERLAEPLD